MESKQVRDLMVAYASVYAQPEEVIAESDCECEGEEKSEKETPEMNGKKKGKKEEEKEEVTEAKRIAHGTGKKVMPSAKKRSALAKEARAGKDIGKPGKGFKKVAAKAAKQYGSQEAGERVAAAAMFRNEEVETDLFDVILEYLVAEGYADTNQSALVIMANMSEDWRQNIVETVAGGGYNPNPVGNAIKTGAGLLQKAMRNPSVQGAIKTGSEMLKKKEPTGGYSTRPGDGKPYADGPLWGPGSGDAPKQPQRKPQAPMRDEPLW